VKKVLIAAVFMVFLTVACQENRRPQNNSNTNSNNRTNIKGLRERANTILHQGLSSENGLIRSHSIEVVSETGRTDMMSAVVKLLKDEFVAVRFTAAMTVGDMNYKKGALSVKALQKDSNVNARIAAAYALTKLGKERLSSVIIEQLRSRDQTIRANSALLLGKLGKKNAHSHLKWVLNDKYSNDMVRIQATEALAMIGVDKRTTYQRLWTLLVSKFGDDKISGIRGMRLLNTEDSRVAIGTMLLDEMPEIRLFAAEQLGRMSNFNGKNEVIRYFSETRSKLDSRTKEQTDRLAAMAIGRIGGPELERYIPMLLDSRHKDVQLRAAQAVLLLTKK
jgi:HEAT repeat protein